MAEASATIRPEQHAAADFSDAMLQVRSRLEARDDQLAVDAITEATLRFGACELAMRRADRLEAVGLHRGEAKELATAAMDDHERGLAALAEVRPLIERLARHETDDTALGLWRESSPQMRAWWRRQAADLDIDAPKARQLLKLCDGACDALDQGVPDLAQHLSATFDEVEKLRRSDDRGTRAESFPYWKIAIAALLWGISIYVIYDMFRNGVPWWQPFVFSVFVGIITFCIWLGC